MNYEQEREDNAVGPEVCEDCGHAIRLHGKYGCEVEGGDAWVDFGNGDRLIARGPCGCEAHEMIEETEETARLAPEQVEHEHPAESLRYDAKRDIFICSGDFGCGAELVIPELSETIRLSVATE